MRTIKINPVLNGFIVEVGCKTLVMPSKAALLNELSRYLDKPSVVEAEYLKNALFDNAPMLEPDDLRMRDNCAAQEAAPPSPFVGGPIHNR